MPKLVPLALLLTYFQANAVSCKESWFEKQRLALTVAQKERERGSPRSAILSRWKVG